MSTETGDNSVANFIQKSFQILENKEYESIIHWMANGREFAIKEIDEFQDHILPKYFRHRNINSFIRQLNMYGFHKSRKDPSKNIFSHPFFLRGQAQILHLVKRKIKNQDKLDEENKLPILDCPTPIKKNQNLEFSTDTAPKKSMQSLTMLREYLGTKPEKEIAPTKTEIAASLSMLSLRSFAINFSSEVSPLKGLMEKSCVMDSNPELYLKMREHNSLGQCELMIEDEDNISIEDEIERERRVFQNRRSGVSILQTYNLL